MNLLEQRPALAPCVRIRNDEVNDEPVLLYPEGVLVLNETARAVAKRCDGAHTVTDIIRELTGEYQSEWDEIERDVCECIADLLHRKLVVLRNELPERA